MLMDFQHGHYSCVSAMHSIISFSTAVATLKHIHFRDIGLIELKNSIEFICTIYCHVGGFYRFMFRM
jgi:hypothetical protein